jgi:DNA mismatch repair ATPase MutS
MRRLQFATGRRQAFSPDRGFRIEVNCRACDGKADGTMIPTSQQIADAKAACGGAVLLFRLGDFYEAFDEDATTISRKLGLTIMVQEEGGRKLTGFPYYQLEAYLDKLVASGHRVAVCEQSVGAVAPAKQERLFT